MSDMHQIISQTPCTIRAIKHRDGSIAYSCDDRAITKEQFEQLKRSSRGDPEPTEPNRAHCEQVPYSPTLSCAIM